VTVIMTQPDKPAPDTSTPVPPAPAAGRPTISPTIRVVAMPADANASGDIFGGWLMSQMDLAAGTAAALRARGRCVTIAIDKVVLHQPVLIGDEVSLYATIIRTGRSSMSIHVETWRRARHSHESIKVTEGVFTFVAIDDERRPRPLPPEPPAAS
jgi:acyl-CoA thioesterase YciA